MIARAWLSRTGAGAAALILLFALPTAGSTHSLASTRAGGGVAASAGGGLAASAGGGAAARARSGSAEGSKQVALHVIPFPGTPDAADASEIILESLPLSDLRSLSAVGSQSGAHTGDLKQLPHSAGTAFTPAQPFDPGEQVTATARLSSGRAGALLGDPGATEISFTFHIQVIDGLVKGARAGSRRSAGVPTQSFHSAPSLHPATVQVSADPDTTGGDILLTPGTGGQALGPTILNARGKVVWFRPVPKLSTANLQVQRYRGHPVLTWWQGSAVWGKDLILNRSYQTVATVRGAEGYRPDLHEFQITPRGTALVDEWNPVRANLSSVGGSGAGPAWDCLIQELDIRTGQLLWEWHSLGHIPLSASHVGKPSGSAPYDACHLNSIQELPGGDLLISSRATWALYKIDRATGRVIWSLGGKHSSFRMGPGTRFEWQHDARLSHHILSVFDDADSPQKEPQSSAKVLRVNFAAKTVSLIRRYTHSPPLLAPLAGSAQIMANGNVFVGWGGEPDFSEYSPDGRQIFSGTLALGLLSYRAFRSPWIGWPRTRPSIALSSAAHGRLWVYASWNGATRVTGWRVWGGPSAENLRTRGSWPSTGFETAIKLQGHPHYVKVQALDKAGKVLGASVPQASPAS